VTLFDQDSVGNHLDQIAFIGAAWWRNRTLAFDGNDGTGLGANQRVWFALQTESVRDEDRAFLLFVIRRNKFAGGEAAKHAVPPMPDEKEQRGGHQGDYEPCGH